MTEYVALVTPDPADDAALVEALEAHKRRRPRDGRVYRYDLDTDRYEVMQARSFCVRAEVEAQDGPRRAWERP